MAGFASGEIHVMCSMDGGTTWNVPHIERAESIPEIVTDLKQYGDKLLIYSESDVYEVSKAELIEQTTSADVEINETTFPDEYFRNWVLANSFGQDGMLTDAEIASVTKLNIGSRRIQSLKGIEFFTELSWLDVTGNSGITEIDLSPFPKMKYLDVGWCKIKELDLSKNTELSYLDCRGNGLTALDLSKNTSLTTLICFDNQLTELDVSQNTLLTEIDCSNNPFMELDLAKNMDLEKLTCIESQLTALDVSQHTALKYLTCYNNLLNSLDVSGCAAIISLKCNNNQLLELDLTDCTGLLSLYCMNNQLNELDLSTNKRLNQLYCQHNNLTKLNVSNNKEIWCLVCNDNQLTELDVSGVTKLNHLHCYRNQLTSLNMSGNPSLINLNCYNNQIKGEAMDALLESMHTIGEGDIYGFRVINNEDEQNVITKAQVAAARAKGWKPLHHVGGNSWQEYEGSDDPVTYTEGQMATIILPEEPDASKGKFYRLDRIEEGKIVFEQELHPQAHVPYIIVPNEDFSIDLNTLDLEGCSPDTVSIEVRFEGQAESQSIYFIGSYVSKELPALTGGEGGGSSYIQIIDTTPDCRFEESCVIGALRAYLLVRWDDPYNQGGTKGRGNMEIVLRDYGTSLASPLGEKGEGAIYDLQGRLLPDKPAKGIYIESGQKRMINH